MSVTTTAAPAATEAGKAKVTSVPKDFRSRFLSGKKPEKTADQLAAEKRATEEADAKAKADKEKADAEKAKATAAAAAPAGGETKRPKKKDVPELPTAKPGAAAAADRDTLRQVVQEVVRETGAGAAASPGTTAAAATAATNVDPEVQRELDIATFAEKKHPDRYNGLSKRLSDYYQSRDQLLNAKAKELGGFKSAEFRDFIEGDEFKSWNDENRPTYQRGDKTKLAEEMISARAREEAEAAMKPKLQELDRKQRALEVAPLINQSVAHARNIIFTEQDDPNDPKKEKDPALIAFAKDPNKFGEDYPEEASIIAQEAVQGLELVQEVYRMEHDLVDFVPDKPSPLQQMIRKHTSEVNQQLREKFPKGVQREDGKILIDVDTYNRLGLEKDPRYRVLTADEIAGTLAATTHARVLDKLRRRREGITKSIYAVKSQPSDQNGQQQAAAAATERPAPGAAVAAAPGTRTEPAPDDRKKALKRKHLTGKG